MSKLRAHIQLAFGATALRYLTHAEVADALEELVAMDSVPTIEKYWVESRQLSPEHLSKARSYMGEAKTFAASPLPFTDTMSLADEPPQETKRSPRTVMGSAGGPAPANADQIAATRRAAEAVSDTHNRYTVVQEIGVGGFGQVTECEDSVLKRSVAIKTVYGQAEKWRNGDEILASEARVTASLEHPNIIPVYDAGIDPASGRYFYAMRLVNQPSLGHVLSAIRAGDAETIARFTLGRLLRDFVKVCEAVSYAHSRGIVHCDLKPDNILLGPFGQVLIVDWGLAHPMGDSPGFRGGTPGYLAPEQLDPATRSFDARVDVFALGAILYQLLAPEPAFLEESAQKILRAMKAGVKGHRVIKSPRERFPALDLPEELSILCMRALEFNVASRLASARDLVLGIEAFLDRTEDMKRRRAESEKHLEAAQDLSERYFEFFESLPDQQQELAKLRAAIAPWDPIEKKRELWDEEALLDVTASLRTSTHQAAVAGFEQCLELVPREQRARRGLARLYWGELRAARARHDEPSEIYFESMVRRYDDDGLIESLGEGGVLSITLTDDDEAVRLSLTGLQERDRRLTPGKPQCIEANQRELKVDSGSYVLLAEAKGQELRYSLRVLPGEDISVEVDTALLGQIAPGEVYVPPGPALLESAPNDPAATALHLIDVSGFFINRFPTTFAEYLEFAREMCERDPSLAERVIPRDGKGAAYWSWDGEWLPVHLPGMKSAPDPLQLPVFGVTAPTAQVYAKWLSKRDHRNYRLPTCIEWEKAARGADGRRFPWGQNFDALFCKMRDSRPGVPFAEPVGTFEFDVSPYGVRDMAGTIAEWVTSTEDQAETAESYYSKGGAWCDWESDCQLGNRRRYFAGERSARIGFRLVRDL